MTTPLPCYHCALPVPSGSRFTAVVLGESREFCCPGCQAVAEAIVAGGLESYYQHRSEASANPEALPVQLTDELALYDRADVQQPFVRHEGELAETTLLMEGISCAACGWLIEKHLRTLPAVAEARLNLSNHRLHVRWADAQLPLSQILAELRHIGYAAHPYQADRASEQLASENRLALRQLGVAGLLWFQAMMATMATWPEFNIDLSPELHTILRWVALFLTTPIVFYSCAPFFKGAMRDLRTRHLTMDVSVSLAIGSAYIAGIWTSITGVGELYFDAVGMFALFLLAGRYLERRARERTAAATAQLVNLLPASCLRLDAAGQSERILLSELRLGDRVLVQPGAILPADGKILDGQSSIDESLLTGEYLPQPRTLGRCGHRRHPECRGRADRRSAGAGPGHAAVGHRPPAGSRPGRETATGGNRRPRRAMVPAVVADRGGRHRPAVVGTGFVAGLLDCPGHAGRHLPVRAVAGDADRPHRRHRHPAQTRPAADTRPCAGRPESDRHGDFRQDRHPHRRPPGAAFDPPTRRAGQRSMPEPRRRPGKPFRAPDCPRVRPRAAGR